MANLEALRSVARNPFAWPGGYESRLLLDDGESICRECVKTEYPQLYRSTRDNDRDGWTVEAVFIAWEGPVEFCAHCGAEMPTEYGDPDEN